LVETQTLFAGFVDTPILRQTEALRIKDLLRKKIPLPL
jgi:hypothetical protein